MDMTSNGVTSGYAMPMESLSPVERGLKSENHSNTNYFSSLHNFFNCYKLKFGNSSRRRAVVEITQYTVCVM